MDCNCKAGFCKDVNGSAGALARLATVIFSKQFFFSVGSVSCQVEVRCLELYDARITTRRLSDETV